MARLPAITFLVLGAACPAKETPSSDPAYAAFEHELRFNCLQAPPNPDPRTQWFRTFDKFGPRGVDRLERAPVGRPHVTLTPRDGGGFEVVLRSTRGCEIVGMTYEPPAEGHRYERTDVFRTYPGEPFEPFPWTLWSVHLVAGVEHTNEYVCDLDPSAPESKCLLSHYIRDEPGTSTVFEFDVDEPDRQVEGRVPFDPDQPLPDEIRVKAWRRTVTVDRIDSDRNRLIRTSESQALWPESRDEQIVRSVDEYDISVYPAEFVDFD